MRNAVELFASFIDEETYCLFYYNGHAVGHSEDIYLAPVESSLDEHDPTPLSQVFLTVLKDSWERRLLMLCIIISYLSNMYKSFSYQKQ